MNEILKLTLSDIFTLGGNDSIILTSKKVILIQDYPRHSLEYSHLREIQGLYLDTIRKTEPKVEAPNHYLEYGKNNTLRLVPIRYKYWLQSRNFAKYFPTSSKTYMFIKIDGKLVEETDEYRIRDYITKDLEANSVNGDFDYFNFMMQNKQAFDPKFLFMLESRNVQFKQDTKDECFLYYQNCIVKVTADNVETIQYDEVDEYVWRNQIIQRDYVKSDHKDSEYRNFLYLVSGENMKRYKTLQSVVGYLLHGYKNKANNRAIILNDAIISENPNGGSGKGLFCTGISHMKKVDSLNGKEVEFKSQFQNQTVRMDCQVLVFQDVKRNFNFENLFSVITEGIKIEYKNQPAVQLPVEKSPRIVITTNYTLGGIGGSHERRKFEVEFTNFFTEGKTPEDHFGHMLFDDWSDEEWMKFDNYMIKCIQVYLQKGLIKCEFENIKLKKFIRNTCNDFYEWTKNHDFVRFNTEISKIATHDDFIKDFPDGKKWVDITRIGKFIRLYCEYYDLDYSSGRDKYGIGSWFMIRNSKNKAIHSYDPTIVNTDEEQNNEYEYDNEIPF